MTSPADHPPRVEPDRAGLLPRHIHLVVVLGLGALLLAVAFIARRGAATSAQADPKQTEAERRTGEDELIRRLREQTQRELGALEARGKVVVAEPEPGADAASGPDYVAPYAPPSRTWAGSGDPGEPSRVDQSRRASNLALSYRAQQPAGRRNAMADGPVWAGGLPIPGELPPGGSLPPFDEYLRQLTTQLPQADPQRPAEAPTAPGPASTMTRNRADGKEHVLFEGSVIETVLLTRLNADFSGPVVCMVTTDLLSHNGKSVLVPAGSKVIGAAKKVETFGQTRVAVAFHRLLMADGYSVDLRQFVGLNQRGETALKDKVNNHYLQLFGASVAVGALGGLVPASLGSGDGRQGIVPSLGQEAMHILDRFLNVLPSITIREGHRVRVFLTQDLSLPAYNRHRMPRDL